MIYTIQLFSQTFRVQLHQLLNPGPVREASPSPSRGTVHESESGSANESAFDRAICHRYGRRGRRRQLPLSLGQRSSGRSGLCGRRSWGSVLGARRQFGSRPRSPRSRARGRMLTDKIQASSVESCRDRHDCTLPRRNCGNVPRGSPSLRTRTTRDQGFDVFSQCGG